jgi:hypothetical protein
MVEEIAIRGLSSRLSFQNLPLFLQDSQHQFFNSHEDSYSRGGFLVETGRLAAGERR